MKIKLDNLFGHKSQHTILCEDLSNPKSLSSYILLKKSYSKLDVNRKRIPLDRRIYLNFRNKFLKKMKKKYKVLTCVYCHQTNLDPNQNNPNQLNPKMIATLDHIIPISKGGKEFDENNCAVACFVCNNKKGDKLIKKSSYVQSLKN